MFPVLAVCLVVSSNIASVMSSSLTVPRRSVFLIGDRVELKCNGSDLTKWTFTAWNTSTETDIYLGGHIVVSMRSRYKAERNISEQHNLIIGSVDWDHAGRYRCIAVIEETRSADIQLNVLGSNPVCAANISEAHIGGREQRHLHLISWCSISYTGNQFPVFSWTKSNAEKNIAANTTTSGRGPININSLIMQQLQANDSGVTLRCLITFQMPNISESVYVYTWNYNLPITYVPRNLRIVEYEDRLECSADGNPTPTYRWTNVETNISTDGPVYILNPKNVNEHTFQCTATNTFASERTNYTIKGVSNLPIKALAIGGSVLFSLIGLIAIILWRVVQGRKLKDDSSDQPVVADIVLYDFIELSSEASRSNIKKGDRSPGNDSSARPDVALNTDFTLYDDTAPSSERSPNNIVNEDHLPGRSDSRTIADNPVYAEVMKPKGPSKGSKGGNICDNSRPPPPPTPNRERKIVIGADGTECGEQSGIKPPARKGEVPQPPDLSQMEIYASIL